MTVAVGIADGSDGIKHDFIGVILINQEKLKIVWLANGVVADDLSRKIRIIVRPHNRVTGIDRYFVW